MRHSRRSHTSGPFSPPLHGGRSHYAMRHHNPSLASSLRSVRSAASPKNLLSASNLRILGGAATAYGLYTLWSSSGKPSDTRNLGIALTVLGGVTYAKNS